MWLVYLVCSVFGISILVYTPEQKQQRRFEQYFNFLSKHEKYIDNRRVDRIRKNVFVVGISDSRCNKCVYKYKQSKNTTRLIEMFKGEYNSEVDNENKKIIRVMEYLNIYNFSGLNYNPNYKWSFHLYDGTYIDLLKDEKNIQSEFYRGKKILYKRYLWIAYK